MPEDAIECLLVGTVKTLEILLATGSVPASHRRWRRISRAAVSESNAIAGSRTS